MRAPRPDHVAIASRIRDGAKVLDVGCGDGALLALLASNKAVDARGLELSGEGAQACLARGFSVVQGDADELLALFPNDGFDVAILSKTIQEMRRPAEGLANLARIAPEVIVSFRNYGHWRRRIGYVVRGRIPAPRKGEWHDAEALHPSTARDMWDMANSLNLRLAAMAPVSAGQVGAFRAGGLGRLNWGAEDAIFHLMRDDVES